MCLYPKLIRNPKYKVNKKNGGNVPVIKDERVIFVPIGCTKCIECRKQKAREWQARLLEDIKENTNGKFITLTFSDESIKEITKQIDTKTHQGYDLDNEIAIWAVRHFLERWRKKYKKSLRHWLVTEIGHNGTENVHLHGIIWTNESLEEVERIWKYGFMWKGKLIKGKLINYVNEATVNYVTKYVSKIDEHNTQYKSKILTSAGIGNRYTKYDKGDWQTNKYNGKNTKEYYRTRTGHKIKLPIYWRNKIYSEEERENLWIQMLDKEERWVRGEVISVANGQEGYEKLLAWHRERNTELGYGGGETNQEKEQYERDRRIVMQKTRIKKAHIKERYRN